MKLARPALNTQLVVLGSVAMLWLVLGIMTDTFFTGQNIQNIMLQMAIHGVIGVGAVIVILSGGIDLSVGSVVGLSNVLLALMLVHWGLPPGLCVLLVLVLSLLCGWVNGVLVYDFRLPPFIATLGMMTVLRGVTLLISGGSNISGLPRAVSEFAQGMWLGIPYLFWVLLLVVLGMECLLRRTTLGRYIYALGSNAEAAKLSGVNTRRVTYSVYALGGLLGGIAGSLETARLWMGVPTSGQMYELDAIAAAVLGGASLGGAVGNAAGAFIGALLMTTIYNGSVLLRVDPNVTRVLVGAILIATVAVDQFRKRRWED